MSVRLMSKVFDAGTLNSTEKLILLAMADYANDDGMSIYPSVASLCRKTALSDRAIQIIIRRLENRGIVSVSTQGNERYKTNDYRINPAALNELIRGESDSPLNTSGVNHVHPRGESDSPGGVNHVHPRGESDSPEPSFNHQYNHQVKQEGAPSTAAGLAQWGDNHAQTCERLYQQITTLPGLPASKRDEVITNLGIILDMYRDYDRALTDGKTQFARWCNTTGKSGKNYSRTNAAWIEKWISEAVPTPVVSSSREMTQEEANRFVAELAAKNAR